MPHYRNVIWVYFVRVFMAIYLLVIKLSSIVSFFKKKSKKDSELEVLLTGNFYSDNWIYAQLRPLVLAKNVKRIRMVSENEVPELPKVEAVYPPKKLSQLLGKDIARLLTFVWLAMTTKVDVVGGFHLLVNGLLAILLGRLTRAHSLYVCGGGAREAAGGGYACENKIFGKLPAPDPVIERQLLKAVSCADIVVARGQRTIDFFRDRGVVTDFYIVPAGIDGGQFKPSDEKRDYDLIMVGRLTEIKRVDIYLRAVQIIRKASPGVRAVIIGDGPLRVDLMSLASELDISDRIDFLGHRDDVADLLQRGRVFVLTSDSEGLSQAMIQAMLCGLPAVVSDVGDLKELVQNGENGFLIERRTPENFALAILKILESDEKTVHDMCTQARQAALRCDVRYVAKTWEGIFSEKRCA